MSSPESPRKTVLRFCAGIFLLFVVYLLGAGPAAYYVHRHHTARNIAIITAAYRPFLGIPMFQAYTKFWVDLAGAQPSNPGSAAPSAH
jgi:hypothetical protein